MTEMTKMLNYPYQEYDSNPILTILCLTIVGILTIIWTIRSHQWNLRPIRIFLLPFISQLAIFFELLIRLIFHYRNDNPKLNFLLTSFFFTIGERTMTVANFIFLMEMSEKKSIQKRILLLFVMILVVGSGSLMIPSNNFAFDNEKIDLSLRIRQLSTGIFLLVTLIFYPIWFWSQTWIKMKKSTKFLMLISSFSSLIMSLFTFIQSFLNIYNQSEKNEISFYIFQSFPLLLTYSIWSLIHPKLSLIPRNLSASESINERTPFYR